jgi:hypothetical protein
MLDAEEEDEVEDYSDMEGVQREGLFDSQHAPPAGEPDYITQAEVEKKRGENPSRGVERKKRAREERIRARVAGKKERRSTGNQTPEPAPNRWYIGPS